MSEPRCSGDKLCTGCNETKTVLAFSVDRTRADGLDRLCRDCRERSRRVSGKIKPPMPSGFLEVV